MLNKRIIYIITLVLILIIGIGIRVSNLGGSLSRTPDEEVYKYYAIAMVIGGVENYEQVVDRYNLSKDMWVYPTPVRIGYIYLCAVAMRLVGISNAEAVLTYISCAASVLSLIMLVIMGLKYFNRWITLIALALISVSPMDLAIAQRAWQDGVLALFGVLLVFVSSHITDNPRCNRFWFTAFYILGGFCLLMKESGIIIYGLCFLWVLYVILFKKKDLRKSLGLIFFILVSVGVSVSIISAVCGGIGNVIAAVKHNMISLADNQYALVYNSGPWYKIIQAFFFMTPVVTVLCFIGILEIVFSNKKKSLTYGLKREIILGIVFFIISFTVISMLPQNLRNLRYFSSIYVPVYLLAGLGGYYITQFFKDKFNPRLVLVGVVVAVSIIAFFDYKRFHYTFVTKEVPDLAVNLILDKGLVR